MFGTLFVHRTSRLVHFRIEVLQRSLCNVHPVKCIVWSQTTQSALITVFHWYISEQIWLFKPVSELYALLQYGAFDGTLANVVRIAVLHDRRVTIWLWKTVYKMQIKARFCLCIIHECTKKWVRITLLSFLIQKVYFWAICTLPEEFYWTDLSFRHQPQVWVNSQYTCST